MVLNISGPTGDRDQHVRDVVDTSIAAVGNESIADLEVIQIDEVDDVPAAIDALRGLGVNVVITTCDTGTVPDVVDEAISNDLLVMTGCTSIPNQQLDVDSELFVDAANLSDSPSATARALESIVTAADPSFGILASDLVPDVDQECAEVERSLTEATGNPVATSARFTELIDDPEAIVAELDEQLSSLDALVLCALAPTVGDLTATLRDAGFDSPIIVPWFADPQEWPESASDVWVAAPSSRHGNDPVEAVNSLYEEIAAAEATDISAADAVKLLADAVQTTGSANPERLAEALLRDELTGLSGPLFVGEGNVLERTYRLIEVSNGAPESVALIGDDLSDNES